MLTGPHSEVWSLIIIVSDGSGLWLSPVASQIFSKRIKSAP